MTTAIKRAISWFQEPSPKRQKNNEDDLICPISHGLPQNPVVAEDGRVYEQEAIEEYIKKSSGDLKSPITREKMGKKLLPAPWVKNTIETMIENGAITGEPADDWTKPIKEKKGMEDLLKKAEGGHVSSMAQVATNYEWARNGFKKDRRMAYKWYDKARIAGSVYGMAKVGNLLAVGVGVTKDKMKAMLYLSIAADRGSDLAAYILGDYLADGKVGFPVDKVEARILLEKSLSGNCSCKDMSGTSKRQAQECLDRLLNGSA